MKKKNFIVLQSEHVDRIKTYPLTTNYYEELIFPIDRIVERWLRHGHCQLRAI